MILDIVYVVNIKDIISYIILAIAIVILIIRYFMEG